MNGFSFSGIIVFDTKGFGLVNPASFLGKVHDSKLLKDLILVYIVLIFLAE